MYRQQYSFVYQNNRQSRKVTQGLQGVKAIDFVPSTGELDQERCVPISEYLYRVSYDSTVQVA